LITCLYMFRLFFIVFHGSNRGEVIITHKQAKVITIPLVILAILSIVGGALNIPEFFGGTTGLSIFLKSSINIDFLIIEVKNSHQQEIILPLIVLALSSIVIYFTYIKYSKNKFVPKQDSIKPKFFQNFIYNKLYIDELYNTIIVKPYNYIAAEILPLIEKYIIDFVVNLAGNIFLIAGNRLRLIQTGNISFYLFIMVIAIISFIVSILYL